MSPNRFLIQAWDNLHFHLHAGRLYAGTGVIDFRQGLEEHRSIVTALTTGDKDQVLKLANAHITNARTRLAVLIQSAQE
jgi:DNA-binding GntR family transcriptional regulator